MRLTPRFQVVLMDFIKIITFLLTISLSFFGALNISRAALPVAVNNIPLPSLADMLERVTPAVVNISTKGSSDSTALKDPVYRHFFGASIPSGKRNSLGTGSGIIVDAQKGLIVTNAHVIEGAGKIIVTLKDKRQFFADLVGKDLKADVAVLRIQPDRLVSMRVADSKRIRVGDFVVAIGNPYGLGQSVTSGIVSALGRTGLGIEQYEDFIQTDAPINPGNSGGALVNLRGELVGINTAILGGKNGGNVGIGFAIPSSMIINIKNQIVEYGHVKRGQLGIEIQDLAPESVKEYQLTNGRGALVAAVVLGSPAEHAGIRRGDVITGINGGIVTNSSNLKSIIGNLPMGSRVNVEFIRNGILNRCVTMVGEASDTTVFVNDIKKGVPVKLNHGN